MQRVEATPGEAVEDVLIDVWQHKDVGWMGLTQCHLSVSYVCSKVDLDNYITCMYHIPLERYTVLAYVISNYPTRYLALN